MRDNALVYKAKLQKILKEIDIHLSRIENAFAELSRHYPLPFCENDFAHILSDSVPLAFADQIIYRFSKAQDSMGAKLFKAFMLYQGENVDKPFLDILNSLEKINILNVDEWFELREIRNEIAHNYENNENVARNIINSIYKHKNELKQILDSVYRKIEVP
jgi:hypothetical protein